MASPPKHQVDLTDSPPKNDQVDLTSPPKGQADVLVIPPDGLCGWHCLVASRDVQGFLAVERTSLGYAKAVDRLRLETHLARTLCKETCDLALERSPHQQEAIERVRCQEFFAMEDLAWIADALQISVRASCDPEALQKEPLQNNAMAGNVAQRQRG
ncbi:hypothetical protein AK812_SmicGene33111 [Symbiodinium microadriaticum]|uniref:Uncharacterized protein n=1 Tax=Symbiodinium microadriaticum TaxID=2951 RepID=A0A1Q9CSH0_SYMMI|nr:hypothetical protein AK812_SmicGene33111 [Symbiodinium microadriaticum]